MIEVEVFGAGLAPETSPSEVSDLCTRAAMRTGIESAHVAVEFVDAARIAGLNARHRHKAQPTDVLSFPIDGVEDVPGTRTSIERPTSRALALDPALASDGALASDLPRELGDIVICPEHTVDLREAVVHGMLHLLGMDHETDGGEMLALQSELLAGAGG